MIKKLFILLSISISINAFGNSGILTSPKVDTGSITDDATITGSSPSINFKDSDATAGDINANMNVNCTDIGNGTEDCDVTFQQQINGSLTSWLVVDADGVINLGGGLAQFNRSLGFLTMGTGKNLALLDDGAFTVGSSQDVVYVWDTNGTGDDLWRINLKASDASSTACVFKARDLDPNNMTITDNCVGYSEVWTFDEGADANDYVGMLMGWYQQTDSTVKNYFNMVPFVGNADGTQDATTTELAPVLRIGDTATNSTYAAAGDVFITQDLEVNGAFVNPGAVRDVGATCTTGEFAFDIGGVTEEFCFCRSPDTWRCVAAGALTD